MENLPASIFSGCWATGHCQGIAVDTKREYIYYSFTTMLVKTDLQGNLIGTVTGLLGTWAASIFATRTAGFTAHWNTRMMPSVNGSEITPTPT